MCPTLPALNLLFTIAMRYFITLNYKTVKKLLYILLPILVLAACKKDNIRTAVAGNYVGAYNYSSQSGSHSGIDTITVTVDNDSGDKLIFTEPDGSNFKVILKDDLTFYNEANCSPHGHFTGDSLIYQWGCFGQPPYSGSTYKLKKQ